MTNPAASATDAVHAIAREAVHDEAAGIPSASSDLVGLDGSVASQSNPVEPGPDSEPDEEDWQFTEEIRTEDDDLEAESDFDIETDFAEDFGESALSDEFAKDENATGSGLELEGPELHSEAEMDASVDDDDGVGLDLGSQPEIGVQDDLMSVGVEAGHDDTSFGAVEDFSELTEDLESESIDIPDLRDASDAGLYSAGGSTDDLGDPENWDLAPGADFRSAKASIAGLVDSFGSPGSESIGQSGAATFATDLDPSHFEADFEEAPALGGRLALFGSAVGWISTLVVVAVVGYLSVEPEWTRWESVPQKFSDGAFAAETTTAGWIDSARSGTLFVVDGIARNTGRVSITPAPLEIALLDAEGDRLPAGAMPVGRPLAKEILREATPIELNQAILESPPRFRSAPLGPGESRAFQLVLVDLPEAAKRFVLTGNESLPGVSPVAAIESAVEGVSVTEASSEGAAEDSADSIEDAPVESPIGLGLEKSAPESAGDD